MRSPRRPRILVTKILRHESGSHIVPLLLIRDTSLITVLVNRLELLQLKRQPEGSQRRSPPVFIRTLAVAGRRLYGRVAVVEVYVTKRKIIATIVFVHR